MTLQIIADKAFKDTFASTYEEKLDAIVEHAKVFFAHSQSLTTKFEITSLPYRTIDQTLTADSSSDLK